jgi:hypothetical protein
MKTIHVTKNHASAFSFLRAQPPATASGPVTRFIIDDFSLSTLSEWLFAQVVNAGVIVEAAVLPGQQHGQVGRVQIGQGHRQEPASICYAEGP